jgi:hypothetical protein
MPSSVIFYSWESDLPTEKNRSLILECLEVAAASIRTDGSLRVEPVVDRDTAGVPGAPDIAATIFNKIDACDVFVCDVSIVSRPERGRVTPNPNVMLELGYALKARGWGQVLLIMNEAYGGVLELPFDLRPRRIVRYHAGAETQLGDARETLGRELLDALRLLYEGAQLPKPETEPLPSAADMEWMTSHREQGFRGFPGHFGISKEVFATLSPKTRHHSHQELLEAADGAQVHTFGWPIGVMSQQAAHMTPKPMKDGIVARIEPDRGSYDYWALRNDGTFYLLKSVYEENNGGKNTVFFDTRIVRATEVCMYLSQLYARLGAPDEARVYLRMNFNGIAGAVLKATPSRPMFRDYGPAAESGASSEVTTTLAGLRTDIVEVVKALTRPLFVLFDYFELPDDAYRTIVESYTRGELR